MTLLINKCMSILGIIIYPLEFLISLLTHHFIYECYFRININVNFRINFNDNFRIDFNVNFRININSYNTRSIILRSTERWRSMYNLTLELLADYICYICCWYGLFLFQLCYVYKKIKYSRFVSNFSIFSHM